MGEFSNPASLGFNDPGGHRLKAARLRTQRAAEIVSNCAALPKPPAYARKLGEMKNLLERPEGMKQRESITMEEGELKGTFSRKGILSALVAADSPAAVPALFAQLREMGVGCGTCTRLHARKRPTGCTISDASTSSADEFLCDLWEASAPPEG